MRLAKLGEKNPRWKGGDRSYYSRIARALYYENHTNIICEHCGSTEDICIHHKDKDYKNNNIDNMQPLCISCHLKHHNLERKQRENVGTQ